MAKTRDCIYESSPTMRRLQRGVRRPQCGLTSAEYSVRNQPSVIFKVIVTNANWTQGHAHLNAVLRCLYAFCQLGLSRKELAHVFIIGNWIRVFESTGTFERAQTNGSKTFTVEH
ncbi:hypothetical protein L917_06811 [Phytophthora nicotianae]|uniref:Uncharacterized protein n=1 Tax=Phytophthora nicotianae TaxID=4792 RepID=W2LD16_PHYNI|nr:hypothetical protein L917_06811 [Phytophthora nicotianae]